MWKVGIKLDKLIFVELGRPGASLQLHILNQRRTLFPEQMPENKLLALLLAQHAAGGDLADSGGRKVDLVFETALYFRRVDAVGCDAVADLLQPLLSRNDDP